MATKKATPPPAKAKAKLVEFVEAENQPTVDVSGIEDPWGDQGEEVPTSLAPTADFKTPGEYAEGIYLGFTPPTKKAPSRLYHLKYEGKFVGVWGSTILDDRMDKLNPPKGATILIQFLGSTPTARGMTEAKLFKVKVK